MYIDSQFGMWNEIYYLFYFIFSLYFLHLVIVSLLFVI